MRTGGHGGAVLCGGRSERFGRDKALIDYDGRPLAERVATVLEAAGCSPVVFVGGDGVGLMAATGREFVADTQPGEGPLGGVVEALRRFQSGEGDVDGVVVAACDLPNLTASAVRAVASGATPACAAADRLHPGLAYWPIAEADHVAALFSAGMRSLHEALDALGATRVPVEEVEMHNVNRPSDLRH